LGIAPEKPADALELGQESLLQMVPAAAARYYGVSGGVVGKRLRTADRPFMEQLAFAPA
jgi:hypothetical protein